MYNNSFTSGLRASGFIIAALLLGGKAGGCNCWFLGGVAGFFSSPGIGGKGLLGGGGSGTTEHLKK